MANANPIKRLWPLLSLACVVIYGCVLRCLHLLDDRHYYVISPDSYFFHWEARRLLEGESISWGGWHSGITHAIAWLAKALNVALGMSIDDSLWWASVVLPLLLFVISICFLYWAVSKMFNQRAGFFAAFAFSVNPAAIFMQSPGYLDRDGLSLLLIMLAAFLFHLTLDRDVRLLGHNVGWLVAVGIVGALGLILYLEWVWLGLAILTAVIASAWVAEVLLDAAKRVVPSLLKPDLDVMAIPGYGATGLLRALRASNWRPYCVLILLGVVAVGILGAAGKLGTFSELVGQTASSAQVVAELQGITLNDLLRYNALLVAIFLGLVIGAFRMSRADSFAIGWFAGLFVAGFFIGRLFTYAVPAACVLSGVGLAYLFDIDKLDFSQLKASIAFGDRMRYIKPAVVVVLVLVAAFLPFMGYRQPLSTVVAADRDWQEALTYLRDNSPAESMVMCHWTFGYYVRDLADRKPFVDNGSWDAERNKTVALAYTADNASDTAAIMQAAGAQYIIFSRDYFLIPGLTEDAFGESYGDGQSMPSELRNSLYARSLSGDFIAGGGLRRVYPDESVEEPRVIILSLGD